MNVFEKINLLFKLWLHSGFHYYRRKMIQPPYWVSIKGKKDRIHADGDDIAIYLEIITLDAYGMRNYSKNFNPSVIVDIGANYGIFSKSCSLLFPNAEIYAYEPNPIALKLLKKNAEGTHIKVFPYVVYDKPGLVEFDVNPAHIGGAKISKAGNYLVKTIPPDRICPGKEIDLLKMDCEGSEWVILKNAAFLKRVKDLRMEYHLQNGKSLKELRKLIENAGHRIVRILPVPDTKERGLIWATK